MSTHEYTTVADPSVTPEDNDAAIEARIEQIDKDIGREQDARDRANRRIRDLRIERKDWARRLPRKPRKKKAPTS